MRNRPRFTALVLAAALAVTSTACGDDDGGGGDASVTDASRPYVDAMKKSMRSANEGEDIAMTDGQIECLAPRFINTIGMERIEAAGVTPDDIASSDMDFSAVDITMEDGNRLYDTFGQCDLNIREAMLESMAADEDTSEAARACMEGVFTDENLRKFMVSSMVNGDDGMEDDAELAPIVGQMMGCAFMGMGDGEGADFDEIGSSINAE